MKLLNLLNVTTQYSTVHSEPIFYVPFALHSFLQEKELTRKLTIVTAGCQTFSDRYHMWSVIKGERIHMQTAVILTVKMKPWTCELHLWTCDEANTLVPVQLTFMYERWSTQFNIFPRGEIQGKKMLIPVTCAACHSKSKTLSVRIKASLMQMIQIPTKLCLFHILTNTGVPYTIALWRWVKLLGVFSERRDASWHQGGYRVQ